MYNACEFGNAASCGSFSRVQLVVLGDLRRKTLRLADEGPWSPEVAAAIRRAEFCGVIDDVAYLAEDIAIDVIHSNVLALHEAFRVPLNPLKLLAEGQPAQALTYSGISVDLESDRIFLDDKRRAKWAAKLRLVLDTDRLTSERVQSVHGIMQRVALVLATDSTRSSVRTYSCTSTTSLNPPPWCPRPRRLPARADAARSA